MLGLTQKQRTVLEFIKKFISANGHSPSYEEIGIGVGLNSIATVYRHVMNLKSRGHIQAASGVARSISLVANNDGDQKVAAK